MHHEVAVGPAQHRIEPREQLADLGGRLSVVARELDVAVADGDADPADGTRGTFDQLYPTPHDKYGLADQIGWKNIHHARAGFEITPLKGLPVTTNYHSWWLAETRDGIYNAGSASLARVALILSEARSDPAPGSE